MLKFGLFAAAAFAAVPALAQPAATTPAAPSAIEDAAKAYGLCVRNGVGALAATVSAELGARNVLAGCMTQRAALESAAEAFMATAPMPEADKAAAREQLRVQLAGAEAKVAQMIQRSRSGATPAN